MYTKMLLDYMQSGRIWCVNRQEAKCTFCPDQGSASFSLALFELSGTISRWKIQSREHS